MQTRFQFLEGVYLPGYMCLRAEDYHGQSGIFDFNPTEPPVAKIPLGYLTPRGAHIFISQAGLCTIEQALEREGFDLSVGEFRELTMQGRMKIVQLNQRFRREVRLGENLQGKMDLERIRWGKLPIVQISFNIANKSITGNFTGVLAPHPVPQTNADITR